MAGMLPIVPDTFSEIDPQPLRTAVDSIASASRTGRAGRQAPSVCNAAVMLHPVSAVLGPATDPRSARIP